ncbi:MAG TPA: GAF domain-containing sensor histidine kinase [Longimicrobium sp.]|nr:GAF domain-containing sensor histidine kinase [Longimicrobium sp.]
MPTPGAVIESPTFAQAYARAQDVVAGERRLAAVRATGLLDSEVEESFDRLTRLAVRLVKIPAAFVSLVDEHRDFYKSACGFGEPLASAREIEGPTFCHFTVQSGEPLVIPDTRADPVYREVPTVRSLGVAAYVGVPIIINGEAVGAFCAIDTAPHAWTDDEVAVLTELAAVAVNEISLRMARAESDRFRAEAEQLAEAAVEARRTLEEQAAELERARAEADAANRAKGDFLAAMSHDLRTPLNAIGGYAQLIEIGVHGPVTDAQRDATLRISQAQRHLLALIDDILQFARTEKGEIPLTLRPIGLAELCESLVSFVEQQAAEKRIAFTCQLAGEGDEGGGELMAVADRERVLQVLVNLSTNAVKFTGEGGSVAITGRRAGPWAEIVVRDTGRGIAAEDLERIFEPFVQVAGAASTQAGVGLGLATSRLLARRMGGDIVVESTPGAGSTFTLRLPMG